MRRGIQWATLLLLLLSPATTWSCEPILPLAQLLGGSSALGPLIWQQSLIWLAAAVALKCGAFAFFERRITWQRALVAMLLANVLSTIPGILVAALTSSMSGIIFAIPLMLLLGIMVGRRAAGPLGEKKHWITGGSVAIGFLIFCLLSVLLYQFADEALAGRHYTSHWVLKFLFVALVAVTGIMIPRHSRNGRSGYCLANPIPIFSSTLRSFVRTMSRLRWSCALQPFICCRSVCTRRIFWRLAFEGFARPWASVKNWGRNRGGSVPGRFLFCIATGIVQS